MLFDAMSGLRVNISKIALIPIGKVPNVNILAHFFGCTIGYLPSFYLDLPLGASYLIKVKWFGTLLLRGSIRD